MADFILALIPMWLLAVLALLTAIHRVFIAVRWDLTTMSRYEHILVAVAFINIAGFYFALEFNLVTLSPSGQAFSRVVFAWLCIVSLYVSHKMARRKRQNGRL